MTGHYDKIKEIVTDFFKHYPLFYKGASMPLFKAYINARFQLSSPGLTYWQKSYLENTFLKKDYKFQGDLAISRLACNTIFLTAQNYIQLHNLLLAQYVTQQNLTKQEFFQCYAPLMGGNEQHYRELLPHAELPSLMEVMKLMSKSGLYNRLVLQNHAQPILHSSVPAAVYLGSKPPFIPSEAPFQNNSTFMLKEKAYAF